MDADGPMGLRARDHAHLLACGQLVDRACRIRAHRASILACLVLSACAGESALAGRVGVVFPRFAERAPFGHAGRSSETSGARARRCQAQDSVDAPCAFHFAGDLRRLLLWLDAVAVPELDTVLLRAELRLESEPDRHLYRRRAVRRHRWRYSR